MKWLLPVLLLVSGCTMFESGDRTKAMADGVTAVSQEYNSVADSFDATLGQLIAKNASNSTAVASLNTIRSQLTQSRTKVAALLQDLMNVVNTSGLDADVKSQLLDTLLSLKQHNQK